MLKTLKLVRGAVADKDLVPVLTHFHIYNGRIQGGNGRVVLDTPCDALTGMCLTVPADRFLKAVDGCQGEPELTVTDAGALMVKRGSFKVRLPLAKQEDFPLQSHVTPELTPVPGLLGTLRRLRPFIGEDASRPWLCTVKVENGYAYATNNPVFIRIPCELPDMVIPVFAVDELLRIGIGPLGVYVAETSMTFDFPAGLWLQCQQVEGEWPDVARFFEEEPELQPVPAGLLEAVRRVKPFCPDAKFPEIRLGPEGVSTADGDMSAAVEGVNLPESRWRAENLELLLSEATAVDWGAWPNPCRWEGQSGAQGVAVGLRG